MDKKAPVTAPDAAKPAPVAPTEPAFVPKLSTTSPPSPLAPVDGTFAERAAKFDRLDTEKHGKLTLEEYQARQSDPEAAEKRFKKFDVNRDGFVTREEYINNGAKKLK